MNVGSVDAEMEIFWMERERGSDVAIIGTGASKRVMKNQDLLNLIYFMRRWVTKNRQSLKRRRYANKGNRRCRREVLNSISNASSSLKCWIEKLRTNVNRRAAAESWLKSEVRTEYEYGLRRSRRLLNSWQAWHAENNYGGGRKVRARKIKGFIQSNGLSKLSVIVRLWRVWSVMQRGRKRKAFKGLRDGHRLRKVATIWSKHILKDGFKRLLRRGRWPLVQARYVRALRVRELLAYWHTLTQLVRCVHQVHAVGMEYYHERSYKWGFKRLISLEAFRRRGRITSYLHDAHCRAMSLHRSWRKLTAYKLRDYDLMAKIKHKTDTFRLKKASERVITNLLDMRTSALELMVTLRKAESCHVCARLGWALAVWTAFAARKRSTRVRSARALQDSPLPLTRARRAWVSLSRRKLYSFVYRSDRKTANVHFVREYFTHFRLETEAHSLNKQQTKIASEIMLARRRSPCMAMLRRNAAFCAKMNQVVRQFSLVYKVKRRWFHRHFTHVRLQHRVRMAATFWHERKQCKFAMKMWLGRVKCARRDAQKVRTFRLICPVPRCSMAAEIFSAWRLEFVPVARRLRRCREALVAHRHGRILSDCLDTWSYLYFVAHAKKAGQRRIIQRLRHFSAQCQRSWLRLLDNFMSARLSSLEKSKLLQLKGQHRLALRCGQQDVEELFVRSISSFGEYAPSRQSKFALRCLVRCRHLSLSKRRFTYLIRAYRFFVAWKDEYTASSVRERKDRYTVYSRLAQHAANYREACETAAEMGKFAVVMRVFYRWRDPLRRRANKLATLLRRTRVRAYIRAWYLHQRKAYIDRTLPLQAIKSRNGVGAVSSASGNAGAGAGAGGGYSKNLLAPVTTCHPPTKAASTQHNYVDRFSLKGDAPGGVEEKPRSSTACAPAPITSTDRGYGTQLATSFSAPMTGHASALANNLETRLRRHAKRTAAQKAMDYDRQRREKIKKDVSAPVTIFEDDAISTAANATPVVTASAEIAVRGCGRQRTGPFSEPGHDGKENTAQANKGSSRSRARHPTAILKTSQPSGANEGPAREPKKVSWRGLAETPSEDNHCPVGDEEGVAGVTKADLLGSTIRNLF